MVMAASNHENKMIKNIYYIVLSYLIAKFIAKIQIK